MGKDIYRIFVTFKKPDFRTLSYIKYIKFKIELFTLFYSFREDMFYHSEISVAKNDDNNDTYSCDYKGINKNYRELSSDKYCSPIDFVVSKEIYEEIILYMDSKIGKSYNFIGFYLNFLPIIKQINLLGYSGKEETFHCNEWVSTILLKANIIKNIIPHKCTAQDIYDIITKDKTIIPYMSFVSKSKIDKILNN